MYAPPAGNAVTLNFYAGYAPPAGNAVAFKFPDATALGRRMSLM
jgi:hypothetical protein